MTVVKNIFKALLAVIALLFVFAAWQMTMYWWEGGVRVADNITSPPLSQQVYYRNKTVDDAATSTKLVSMASGDRVEPYMGWTEKWAYWNAMRKFPRVEDCLIPQGQKSLDVNQFNWKILRTNVQVEICLFHIGTALKTPELISGWVETQGFDARLGRFEVGLNSPMKTEFGYSIHATWVSGVNRPHSPYPLFSEQTLDQYSLLLLLLSGGFGKAHFQIAMDANHKIFQVRANSRASK